VNSVENLPLSIVKDKHYAFNDTYLSDYCMFARVLMSLPPLDGVKNDFYLGVEFDCCDGGPSDSVHYKIVAYVNCTT